MDKRYKCDKTSSFSLLFARHGFMIKLGFRPLHRNPIAHKSRRIFQFARNILPLVFVLGASEAGRAQFTTVAHDGFNYGSGSLAGQNGGTGWTSAWINDYTSGTS